MDETPVGRLLLAGSSDALQYLLFSSGDGLNRHQVSLKEWTRDDTEFADHVRELRAYFAGDLREFQIPVDGQGTEFQRTVWKQLLEIPFGETATYGDIAKAIGRPTASRAVGMANGRNPVSIIVPCHRVIGSSGKLVGYGGGIAAKKTLLDLEDIVLK